MIWRRRIEPFLRPLFHLYVRTLRGATLGVRALVLDDEGRVLLVEHTYIKGWYMPGGGVERGETAEHALGRELVEEAGVEMIGRPRLISIHDNRRVFKGDHVLLYRVEAWTPCAATSRGEILNVGWFAPDALPAETTHSTRRRLAEALGADDADPMW